MNVFETVQNQIFNYLIIYRSPWRCSAARARTAPCRISSRAGEANVEKGNTSYFSFFFICTPSRSIVSDSLLNTSVRLLENICLSRTRQVQVSGCPSYLSNLRTRNLKILSTKVPLRVGGAPDGRGCDGGPRGRLKGPERHPAPGPHAGGAGTRQGERKWISAFFPYPNSSYTRHI